MLKLSLPLSFMLTRCCGKAWHPARERMIRFGIVPCVGYHLGDPHGRFEQLARRGREEQAAGRFLERREVGNDFQFQQFAQRGMVFEVGRQATIIDLQKVLEDQAGKELILRKLLGAETVAIFWQRPPSRRQSRPRHRLR